MIPKVIYYCWFGKAPLPKLTIDCINSWKEHCPGYEIRRIDETNFDIYSCRYAREAYACRKWAFVSDFARIKVLEENGGLYFDTDVELVRPIESVLENGSFLACENYYDFHGDSLLPCIKRNSPGVKMAINPGLAMGFEPHNPVLGELLAHYYAASYITLGGREDRETIVTRTTGVMASSGFKPEERSIQRIRGVSVYPPEFFAGFNHLTGKNELTSNTYAVHHYASSWTSSICRRKNLIRRHFIGKGKIVYAVGYAITAPFALCDQLFRNRRKRIVG